MAEPFTRDQAVEMNNAVLAQIEGRAFAHRQAYLMVVQAVSQLGAPAIFDKLIEALRQAQHSIGLTVEDEGDLGSVAAEEFAAIADTLSDYRT